MPSQIGRECARLARAFRAKVIVANSSGKQKAQEGWIEEETGDPDGRRARFLSFHCFAYLCLPSIPTAWYSSSDANSFASFLGRCDILLLALPSTTATRHILSAHTLADLPSHSLVVNVGRGDAIDTDALLRALDGGKLAGAALDVTDPEPLPDGHPLFGRRNVLLTPHMSGRTLEYWERALDIFEANLTRWRRGEEVWNRVDLERGY
jgi:phosphoglycerate dehydrogenase-like enzyme